MRPQDKTVFLEAARLFQAWILVRRTNPASLEYIGRRGYTPKPIDCKAKTADSPHPLAGLVIDPRIHPNAFAASKQEDALHAWTAMQPLLGHKYTVDEDKQSKHYGCLMLDGRYIHGDYDLYDVVDVLQLRRNLGLVTTLEGQPHTRAPRFYALQDFINAKLGAPMIQHSGNAQYAAHPERPLIDVFGPQGEFTTISDQKTLKMDWYEKKFKGRRTLVEPHW